MELQFVQIINLFLMTTSRLIRQYGLLLPMQGFYGAQTIIQANFLMYLDGSYGIKCDLMILTNQPANWRGRIA